MLSRAVRSTVCVMVAAIPACVIPLADRNSPAKNGAVTGPAANCATETPLGKGAVGGEAAPKFVGRFFDLPDAPGEAEFDWSGNYITARFTGTDRITAKLALPPNQHGVVQDLVFTFQVDDRAPTTRRITVKTDPVTHQPTLEPLEDYEITGLTPNDEHEVTIYRNTEAQKGPVVFKGFDLGGGRFVPPTRRPRRIEFIGDSIICGYGDEGKNATCPFEVEVRTPKDAQGNPIKGEDGKPIVVSVPVTENQYLSFSSIAARELDADAVTVCWSGKGVYKNYKERTIIDPDTKQVVFEEDTLTTVPQLWSTRTLGGNTGEEYKWDFSKEKPEDMPQVVFISLGTNDFSRDTKPQSTDPTKLPGDNVPDGDMNDVNEREKFYQAYLAFVREVRAHRGPNAHIFIATPPMVTDQFPLDNARRNIKAILLSIVDAQQKAGDNRVYQMDLVEQGFRYGLGCDYHPNLEVHRIMAEQVVGAIRSKTCW